MESLIPFIQEHAAHAHWYIFGFLMLAGLNFPVSEDLMIILSGVLASNFIPENTVKLFVFVFLGAFISDWMVYWMGRLWGHKLFKIRWFSRLFRPHRLSQIRNYYSRYGFLTLLVGRFIPFGVRNCLFATAGLGRMRFWKFLIADGVACLLSNASLFLLSYYCGKNLSSLLKYINVGIFSLFVVALIAFIWYKKRKTSLKREEAD